MVEAENREPVSFIVNNIVWKKMVIYSKHRVAGLIAGSDRFKTRIIFVGQKHFSGTARRIRLRDYNVRHPLVHLKKESLNSSEEVS